MNWREMISQCVPTQETTVFCRGGVVLCVMASLAGCGALPSAGPAPESYSNAQTEHTAVTTDEDGNQTLPFALVDVDTKVLKTLVGAEDSGYFQGTFTDRSPPTNVYLGVGDTIRITIFEAGPGGLFGQSSGAGSGGNYTTLPDQEVDQTGCISVPYADKNGDGGLVKVHGRRPAEVQNEIQQRLMNKAIEPQVILTLVKRTSNLYSVIGDVGSPGRFSLDQGGVRILDALSTAGGPKGNEYNTLITLQRGATSASARLATLLNDPENNVFVQPSDLISVKKEERYYNVLGATHTNNRIAFEAANVSVADALAKAGGLNSDVAEPEAVVIFRREDAKLLQGMGVDLSGFKDTDPVPTVYRFDLTDPRGMFLAQKMALRNNDVVYVSNHPFSDATKILGALRDVLLINLIGK